MKNLLTTTEASALAKHEGVIEAGQKTFVEVGQSLLAIRESRLYRAEHGTFEEYCLSRWGMARQYANRLISGAAVATNLVPTGTIPETERAIRPLTKLAPAQQREVWTKANEKAASEDRPVTARDVGDMVVEIVPPEQRKKRAAPFVMPDRGMFLARGAISQLEQILPNDGERTAAIIMVRDWCNNTLTK